MEDNERWQVEIILLNKIFLYYKGKFKGVKLNQINSVSPVTNSIEIKKLEKVKQESLLKRGYKENDILSNVSIKFEFKDGTVALKTIKTDILNMNENKYKIILARAQNYCKSLISRQMDYD